MSISEIKFPYYIVAPDYTDNSSGIVVLHKLCDTLNYLGFESYLYGTKKRSDKLNTPIATECIIEMHHKHGLIPIVIYPEVVSGNPINASVVVRYMLNKEGVIAGNKINSGVDDLFFYYSKAFSMDNKLCDILYIDPCDYALFEHDVTVSKDKSYLYINRIPEEAIDFSVFPADIEILSNKNPLPLEILAAKLKEGRVLYSYEFSGTCTLAMLCGCPVVALKLKGFETLGFNEQNMALFEGHGLACSDDEEELTRIRSTLPALRSIIIDLGKDVEKQFCVFIEKTQKRALEVKNLPDFTINNWLANRVLGCKEEEAIFDLYGGLQKIILYVLVDSEDSSLEFQVSDFLNFDYFKFPEFIEFRIITLKDRHDISRQLGQLSADGNGWILIVKNTDYINASGLLMALLMLENDSALRAVYFDQLYKDERGVFSAALRPSVNLDYLLSFPAGMSKHWLFNRQALLDIGDFNPQLPDALELDAILRLINHGGIEGLGHIAEPLVITHSPALANIDDERKAIEAHLQQRGYVDAQVHAPKPGRYQIRYNHPQQPIVSIVIVAEASLAHMQRCVEGLLSDTTYQNFEILLFATKSTSSEVSAWLANLASLQEAKLRVFNFPAGDRAEQCNQAALQAIGDYLLFLSADTSVISAHWLDELLNHAQRGEIGVVGAKLVSPSGKIAHAGHILGLEGPLGSPFVGEDLEAPGYMQRLQVDQNLSAVGIDCFMVLRELFVELDGFAENQLATEYLSADFCLRAREAGFLTVWTPHAQLMLEREVQVRPSSEQQDAMYAKWLPQLARDPAYNPNFSLSMPGGFKLADSQISWRPLEGFRPEPVALVHPADLFGCGHYRVMQPFLAMKEAGLFDGAISTGLMHVTDLERYNPDTIILQRQIGDERLEAMQRMQRFSKAFKVYELDDYLPNLPLKSVHRANMPKDILRSLRKGLSFVDRFVVSTGALAEAFSELHNEIVVMENRLPVSWWQGLKTQRRQGKKPRVGWAGGSSHTGDLELIADVVRDLADEVEWVFFGMCPDKLRPYVHEYHDGVAIELYPAKLASLNLDLGLAPLEMNLFNECKSNLRLLEYGACGIPVVCTDIRCYQNDFPVTRVRNRYKDWVEAIRLHISDLDATAKLGDELQAKVRQEWMLEGVNLELWRKAWLPN